MSRTDIRWRRAAAGGALTALALAGCTSEPAQPLGRQAARSARSEAPANRPSILLVTLDTTRADVVAPEGNAAVTPVLAALAARSQRFAQAYATAPMTLPSHASMLTGLYPAGHGLHENGRRLADGVALAPERLRALGYATAAFVSGYPLERQFGLARGFDVYDDDFGDGVERSAEATVARALRYLGGAQAQPRFLWVHLYDPHEPYAPPEPFRSRFPDDPYLGEVAAMDAALGPLLAAFESSASAGFRLIVAADHGEGRGDHGEALHGNLLYQGVMRVPLLIAGSGVAPGLREDAVSLRQIAPTLLTWAGETTPGALVEPTPGPVLGEAMQPFLQYRWQPQVMAVDGRLKAISAGRVELYDVVADPAEAHDLSGTADLPRALRTALRDYPLPWAGEAAAAAPLGEEERKRLASLGYIASEGAPVLRADAPRPADMTALFHDLDVGSRWFVDERYRDALPLFERVLARDPGNLMVAVRIAVAHSALGEDRAALEAFDRARRIDPDSLDARHYLAMHHLRYGRFERAAPLFEAVLAGQPDKLPALRGLAEIRARQGRAAEAIALHERAARVARDAERDLLALGGLHMQVGNTDLAIDAFERARAILGERFPADLELGVLYLAAQRLAEARTALDRVAPDSPQGAMALFKRAQVSVLLGEPDAAERIAAARARADATTLPLIERERLFAGR